MTGRKTFDLYKSGCVVDLTVGTWIASIRLDAKDLGLTPASVTHRDALIWLGRKRLVRKGDMKAIRKVINRATNHLYSHSFAFPFGQVQFVPFRKLDRMIEVMAECEKDFWAAVEEFLGNYETIRNEVLKEYAELFAEILFEKTGRGAIDQVLHERDRLVVNLASKYPTREQIRSKFNFDFMIFEVASPKFKSLSGKGALEAAETDNLFRAKLEKKVDGFLDGVMGQLKTMAVETVDYMTKRIESNKINFKTVGAFRRYVESFKDMNFSGWEIERKMEDLGKKLEELSKSDLENESVKHDLSDAVAELKKQIVNTNMDEVLGTYRLLNLDTGDVAEPSEPSGPESTRSLSL